MNKTSAQPCPFCGLKALFEFVDYENRKHFLCPTCKEFEISKYAESLAGHSSAEWKSSNSKASQAAPSGSYYCLTRPSTPKPGVELEGKYVRKSH